MRCSVSNSFHHFFRFICGCVLDQFCCTSGGHSWPNGRLKSNPMFNIIVFGKLSNTTYWIPPPPPNGKSFCQKNLVEMGGTPLPPNGKSPKIVTIKSFKNSQNQRLWTKNTCFLVEFFLSGIRGYPPPSPQRKKCA